MKATRVTSTKLKTHAKFLYQSKETGIPDFAAKKGEIAVRYEGGETLIYCGLGEPSPAAIDRIRAAAAQAVRKAIDLKRGAVAFHEPPAREGIDPGEAAYAMAEGAAMGNYVFTKHKAEKAEPLAAIEILGGSLDAKRLQDCMAICRGVDLARDLVNENASDIDPAGLAARAEALAKEFPALTCSVLTEKEIKKEKLGLLLAVGQGSRSQPRLIMLDYEGDPRSKRRVALVGKGVTFDSGGYNLKPTGSIETMRDDMAGAAAVLGAMRAVAELKLKVNVVGVVPAAHNALQGDSFFPGDIYRSYSGKTVQIESTDAEGRLILADAIAYCQAKRKPTAVIDIATLTGSIVRSFGDLLAGLFSNDDALAAALLASGARVNEPMWRMPLLEAVGEAMKGDLSDLRNTAKLPSGHAGAIAGAAFIQAFVQGGTPWAHIDIGGTGSNDREERGEIPKHGTGYGVRLFVDYLRSL